MTDSTRTEAPSDPRQAALNQWAAEADKQARNDLLLQLYQMRRERRPRLTQAQVAERMGISQATVSAFESRQAVPRLTTLQRYARAIGVRLVVHLDHSGPEQEFADKLAEFDAAQTEQDQDHIGAPEPTTAEEPATPLNPRFSAMTVAS